MVDWSGRTRCRWKRPILSCRTLISAAGTSLAFKPAANWQKALRSSFKRKKKKAPAIFPRPRWREDRTRAAVCHESKTYGDVLKRGRCSRAGVGVRWREARLEVVRREEVGNWRKQITGGMFQWIFWQQGNRGGDTDEERHVFSPVAAFPMTERAEWCRSDAYRYLRD